MTVAVVRFGPEVFAFVNPETLFFVRRWLSLSE
jgi:hypothetical protein